MFHQISVSVIYLTDMSLLASVLWCPGGFITLPAEPLAAAWIEWGAPSRAEPVLLNINI